MNLRPLLAVLFLAVPALAQDAGTRAPAKGGAKTTATWWGHAAWIITTPGGATIAIDPWLENPSAPKGAKQPEQLDAILVTHGHSDHVGNTVALAKRTGAQVITSHELAGLIGAEKSAGGNVGGTLKVKDATIHLVEAVHSSGFGDNPKAPLYGGPAMGFVIAIDNGPTLYHAGDTGLFSSMALLAERFHPTVALLPIGGHYTMDPSDAAYAATKLLKVKTVVPMHFGTFPMLAGTPDQLRSELKKQKSAVQVLELKPGESTAF